MPDEGWVGDEPVEGLPGRVEDREESVEGDAGDVPEVARGEVGEWGVVAGLGRPDVEFVRPV